MPQYMVWSAIGANVMGSISDDLDALKNAVACDLGDGNWEQTPDGSWGYYTEEASVEGQPVARIEEI